MMKLKKYNKSNKIKKFNKSQMIKIKKRKKKLSTNLLNNSQKDKMKINKIMIKLQSLIKLIKLVNLFPTKHQKILEKIKRNKLVFKL